MAIDYTNPDWYCIHGVVNHQCRKCKDPSLDRPAVLPAMQRALGEGEYNTIGDELRKTNDRLSAIEARLSDLKVFEPWLDAHSKGLCNLFDLVSTELVPVRSRFADIEEQLIQLDTRVEAIQENQAKAEAAQQLIMQKLEIGENEYGAEFTQLKCLLDLTNKRLRALELDGSRRARKRQPKPIRRKKGRK